MNKARLWDVILGTLVTICLGLGGWGATTQVEQGKLIAAVIRQQDINTTTLNKLEDKGSAALQAYREADSVKKVEDAAHFARLDAAYLEVMKIPGDMKAINVTLDTLKEGQNRIEKALSEHMKDRQASP